MSLELGLILEAVGGVGGLVKQALSIAETVRTDLLGGNKNKETKQKLTEQLQKLEDNVRQTGQLAVYLEGYLQTHENVLELLALCLQTRRFLEANAEACRNRDHAAYPGNWSVIGAWFEIVDSRRDAPRKVVQDRAEWYDVKDKAQIEAFLQQFTSAYDRASVSVRTRVASDLLHELSDMIRPLQETDTALRTTIFDQILKTLQGLRG